MSNKISRLSKMRAPYSFETLETGYLEMQCHILEEKFPKTQNLHEAALAFS